MLTQILSIAVDLTLITLTLALAAFGLAIIYGLVGVINMGHGALLTLGAYLTWQATAWNVPFVFAVLFAAAGVCIIGLIFEHLVIRHFYDRPFDTLLLTWAFFLIVTELIKIVFGTDLRNVSNPLPGAFEVGGIHIPAYRAAVALFAVMLIAATAWLFYRTSLGIRIRALIQNREVAGLLGLNISLTYKIVFGMGAFMAGLAGGLVSPMLSIDPYIGNVYLVRSFFVVLVGGMGQLLSGTLIGSFFTGGSETLFALFSSQAVAQTAVFALAILILRFRPDGVLKSK
ncbi:high-affinity branched-chain amino acid transport system permease [Salinisphaera shabanensis T35B1]|uniref:branched-chain amino acid ABC transporter permease n=1 Tax=Salinisphaera shabanensis TaxID=180542 RepID=UPI00333F9D39